ncbi:predicted ATP-dependent endonuclease, OLD family protein [marine actinobacterium PHSC20C1]|nr:predicted ATP-dependent endonuclease, OLD family protein [marine actinobacterium PHSC20C1]
MKVSHIVVENYRSLRRVELSVTDYTALVGANGSGKSSVLYALQWFYEGGALEGEDICGYHRPADGEVLDESSDAIAARTVSVTVTFSDLTSQDRSRLREYGRGDTAVFRKSWVLGDAKPKVVGNAKQGPGFAELRTMKLVGDFRPAYASLRHSQEGLPDLGGSPSRDQVSDALVAWEADPANGASLVDIADNDANHMFGIDGPNIILRCSRLVLIPAAAEISNQVGSSGKGSALGDLIGAFMSNAGATARAKWQSTYADELAELNSSVKRSVEASTGLQASRINSKLVELVPNAAVSFVPAVPDWTPKGEASVTTDVTIDGTTNDVSKQGHGIQRAIMIAMFQSLLPDAALLAGSHNAHADETVDEAQARLQEELANLPTLVVCIEEPEIYQHPVRARAFARVLAALASQQGGQVLLATHSPYFVRPDQFSSVRRFRLVSGVSKVRRTSLAGVAALSGDEEVKVQKILEKRLPTSFSEGFFADAVVLVEGETDKAVLEAIAEVLGQPLDSIGVCVLEVSAKDSLKIPYSLFSALEIPTYVIADGDALGAARTYPDKQNEAANAHASHRASTERITAWLPAATALQGESPHSFGSPTTIAEKFTIWNDDIEEELAAWPSFVAALLDNGGKLRKKDLLAYRTAVFEADIGDLPSTLRTTIDAICAFRVNS